MATYWAMKKTCATCEYWNGPRKLVSDNRVVEVPNGSYDSMKGVCGGNSPSRGKLTHAGDCWGGGTLCWVCMRGVKEH